MPKLKTPEQVYDECMEKGFMQEQELVNIDKIRTMMDFANALEMSAREIMKGLDKKDMKWSVVYTLHYDALHELAEAFVALDKKKIFNHQCLFSYLIIKHPELVFDWNFLEKIRTQRNGMHYYGSFANYNDWKEVEAQFKIYINALRKAVKDKINKD